MRRTVLTEGMSMKRFKNSKQTACFSIFNKVTRGSLIMKFYSFVLFFFLFLSSFPSLSYSYYLFKSSNFLFFNFIIHLLTIHLSLVITPLLLLLLFIIMITIIINTIVMFINITFAAILEKSIGGEFQARNSSAMVYPNSSR